MVGKDPNGNRVSIPYASRKKVLLLAFSPTCGVCMENWANWKAILQAANVGEVTPYLVNISTADTSGFLASHDPQATQVIVGLPPEVLLTYRFRATPQTILVGRDHRVVGVWTGLLTAKATKEVIAAVK